MEFSIKSGSADKQRGACIVVGVFEQGRLSPAAEALDRAAQGYLADILKGGDMDGKPGATLMLHRVPGLQAARVLLVGLGAQETVTDKTYRDASRAAIKALNDAKLANAVSCLTDAPVNQRDMAWKAEQAVLQAEETLYQIGRASCRERVS
jgi:leucyl aminopeptidase